MSFVLVVRMKAKEGEEARAVEVAARARRRPRAQEPGCEAYVPCQRPRGPAVVPLLRAVPRQGGVRGARRDASTSSGSRSASSSALMESRERTFYETALAPRAARPAPRRAVPRGARAAPAARRHRPAAAADPARPRRHATRSPACSARSRCSAWASSRRRRRSSSRPRRLARSRSRPPSLADRRLRRRARARARARSASSC